MKAIVIMGVSGSGKTTIGQLLAQESGGTFLDGDDFHPPENVVKMSQGLPLTDADRQGWLETLARIIHDAEGLTIIACSALKATYRETLNGAQFIFLQGSPELLAERLQQRQNHYMPPTLLQSQLDTLEAPQEALTLDIKKSPSEIVSQIRSHFGI